VKLIIDAYCGAGGTAMGYHYAFPEAHIIGVDHKRQKNFPFEFVQMDALRYLKNYRGFTPILIHASPPCLPYTPLRHLHPNEDYSDLEHLIADTRAVIMEKFPTSLYVIENVLDAPLIEEQRVGLCGAMFPGLRIYRHRFFETNFPVRQPQHPEHIFKAARRGRAPEPGEWSSPTGRFGGAEQAQRDMQIPWMSGRELRNAIPPPYTRYIGREARRYLLRNKALRTALSR
jgi:DNA (cytosine-5)-methyltransferase 1